MLWLVLAVEIIAAILILIGIVSTVARMIHVVGRPKYEGYEGARLRLARFLALEFRLAADVLATRWRRDYMMRARVRIIQP